MQIRHKDFLLNDLYRQIHGIGGVWRFFCLPILHLFGKSSPRCKFEVLSAHSHYCPYSKAELELHFQADRHKNKQRCLLIPFVKDLCSKSSNLLHKLLQQLHSSAPCKVYDGYIHYWDPSNLRLHLHNKSDLQ